MKKWNMIIDIEKCEDCNNCFLSCKDEHVENDWLPYSAAQPRHGQRWMNIMRKERGQYPLIDVAYRPTPCMHCDNAPCIKAAKDGAVYKRSDGIVIIDPVKARGQRSIVGACPYGAIWWNEEKEIPQKCTLCAHLLDQGWEKTRCVQACPTGALSIVKMHDNEMAELAKREKLDRLLDDMGTLPRVWYRNLYRFEKCFIAGSVAYEHDGITACAKGALVRLLKDASMLREAVTDSFGDFKFDGLDEDSGRYTLKTWFGEYKEKTVDVDLKLSLNVGVIRLSSQEK
ncbi:MAG: oxidoreductase [Deltaproteobacteria bacterium]|nr:oxidoreductase [Deltaproteobacteria bacterium]